jgi:hypothetical protein
VKFNACAQAHPIQNVEGSSGAFYNADCSTIYVLPPQNGRLTISAFQPGADLDLRCGRVRTVEDDEYNMDKIADSMSRQLLKLETQIEVLQKDLEQGLTPVGLTEEQTNQKIDDLTDRMVKERGQLDALMKQKSDERLTLSAEEGGRGTFVLTGAYTDLLKAYQKANPGVAVERLPLDESFLSFNKQTPADRAALGAVIRLDVQGVNSMPLLPDPTLLMSGKDTMPFKAPDSSLIFGDALSGDITLSLAGACALREGSGGGLQSFISAGATYAYQVQVRRDYKASLDLSELIRQIHQQTKKGGFFSSKTLDSFLDSRRSTEWVTFEDQSEDGRLQYTDEQIVELKKEFLDRALAEIVDLKTGSSNAIVALITPGKNGADQAGDALSKCANAYCQIGAAGLHVLSAIFGSDTAVSDLTKQMDARHEESMTSLRMVTQYGTYSFQ